MGIVPFFLIVGRRGEYTLAFESQIRKETQTLKERQWCHYSVSVWRPCGGGAEERTWKLGDKGFFVPVLAFSS